MLEWLNTNSTAVSAVASLVSAAATVALMATTIVYAWLTGVLAGETRRLRRAGTEPDVIAYLLPHPVHLVVINVVVVNVGKGPAFDVALEFEGDAGDFAAHNVRYIAGTKRTIMAVMPQDERYAQMFGAGEDLFKDEPLKDFTLRVHFSDATGKRRSNSAKVSIKDFDGFGGFDPPDYEMAKTLKTIADQIRKWSVGSGRLGVDMITQQEQAERDQKIRERVAGAQQAREERRKATLDDKKPT